MEKSMAAGEMDYKRYLNLINRNKKLFVLSALAIMTVITIVCYLLPNKYEATSTVFIERSVIADLVKGLAVTPSVDDKIKALTYAINSRTLIMKVVDELDLNLKNKNSAQTEKLINDLQANTRINIKDKEGLFIISFVGGNPKQARDYVNTLVRRYIEENTSSKREDSYGATKFISEQVNTFREKLIKAEDAVNEFKRGNGSISAMDTGVLLKDINDAQQRVDELKIKQAQLETALANAAKSNSAAQSNLPLLQKKLQELQLQYTDSYPEIIKTKDEIQALEQQIKKGRGSNKAITTPEQERITSELRALRQAEANLLGIIATNRGLLRSIPAAKAELDDLEREKNAQKILYDQLVAREGQSEMSKQMEVQDKSTVFRIVDPAVMPIKPVSPNRTRLLMLGILVGIGGGIGLVLLKDQMDHSIKNIEMVKDLGLPLLAVIPHMNDPEQDALQVRRDRRLYIFSGVYFSFIVAILMLELLNITIISDQVGKIYR